MFSTACDQLPVYTIPACLQELILETSLVNTALTLEITSALGISYKLSQNTSAQGQFVIDTTLLPQVLLNPYSGIFELAIYKADQKQLIYADGKSYDYLLFKVNIKFPLADSYKFPFKLAAITEDNQLPDENLFPGLDFAALDSTLILA